MKIRPSSQRLLVKLQKPAEKSSGGILIPAAVAEQQKRESELAEVLAVGPGKLLDDGTRLAPVAEVGDVVVVYRGAGHEMVVDGEEHRMIHELEILGVVEAASTLE